MSKTLLDAITASATPEQYKEIAKDLLVTVSKAFQDGNYRHNKVDFGQPGFISIEIKNEDTVEVIKKNRPTFIEFNMDMNILNLTAQELLLDYFTIGDDTIHIISSTKPANPKSQDLVLTGFADISDSQGEIRFNIVYIDNDTKEEYENTELESNKTVVYLEDLETQEK